MLAKSQIESMASEHKPVDGSSRKASCHLNPSRSQLEVVYFFLRFSLQRWHLQQESAITLPTNLYVII